MNPDSLSCQIHLCLEHVWVGLHQLDRMDRLPGLALPAGGAVWTPGGAGGHHLPHSSTRGMNIKYALFQTELLRFKFPSIHCCICCNLNVHNWQLFKNNIQFHHENMHLSDMYGASGESGKVRGEGGGAGLPGEATCPAWAVAGWEKYWVSNDDFPWLSFPAPLRFEYFPLYRILCVFESSNHNLWGATFKVTIMEEKLSSTMFSQLYYFLLPMNADCKSSLRNPVWNAPMEWNLKLKSKTPAVAQSLYYRMLGSDSCLTVCVLHGCPRSCLLLSCKQMTVSSVWSAAVVKGLTGSALSFQNTLWEVKTDTCVTTRCQCGVSEGPWGAGAACYKGVCSFSGSFMCCAIVNHMGSLSFFMCLWFSESSLRWCICFLIGCLMCFLVLICCDLFIHRWRSSSALCEGTVSRQHQQTSRQSFS